MKIFSLTNLSASTHTDMPLPWANRLKLPPGQSKATHRVWCRKPRTSHQFYTAFEPLNPAVRVSTKNPPHLLHGIVADYDTELDTHELHNGIKNRAVANLKPSYLDRTRSGGVHAVWVFEKPLLVDPRYLSKLLKLLAKELNLDNIWTGFDDKAFENVSQYYCSGDWESLSKCLVPTSLLYFLQEQASRNVAWGEVTIPLDKVADEVEKQYPGRWPGKFELSARGPRFWDTASMSHSAYVHEEGMLCHSGDEPFVPWQKILGRDFVRDYEADRMGGSIEGFYYDGTSYYTDMSKTDVPNYEHMTRISAVTRLKCRGLSATVPKDDTASQVERAIDMIERVNRVVAAVPFVLHRDAEQFFQGKKYLNTSSLRALEPVKGICAWGEGFEWLAHWYDQFFAAPEQLERFLSWLHRVYSAALNLAPVKSQALFVCGDTSTGKSLCARGVVGGLLGGFSDAERYLTGKSQFNSDYFERALWSLDDDGPSTQKGGHIMFSNLIKKVVANHVFSYEAKFKNACTLPWYGTVTATCNADPRSLRMIPDLDINILDKMLLFRVNPTAFQNFPDRDELDGILKKELPHLAAFLRDYRVPEHCKSTARFGIKSFHDPELMDISESSKASQYASELIEVWLRERYLVTQDVWSGSIVEMMKDINTCEGLDKLNERSPAAFGLRLHRLGVDGSGWFRKRRTNKGMKYWLYNPDQPKTWPKNGECEHDN